MASSPPSELSAEVLLRGQSGESLTTSAAITADVVFPYLPSSEDVQFVMGRLAGLGFKAITNGVTISISGPTELFQSALRVEFKHDSASSELQPTEPIVPEDLRASVERIVFPDRPEFF